MKTVALKPVIESIAAESPTVRVSEEGGQVLLTAANEGALRTAFATAKRQITALGRAVSVVRCRGRAIWQPDFSSSVRCGLRVALSEEEMEAHIRGL